MNSSPSVSLAERKALSELNGFGMSSSTSGALAELKALRDLNGLSASARGPWAFYNACAADLHAACWADLSSVEPQAP